ncbi:protein ERGIC-53-like isoform X2 [Ruditapes philippinarum]|uniref:protein ERGIC-53-like isoform X2 n=1 Tax=Ruditapes philippinarum TaxID=129788 RepID=UPI00295BC935|nr:protein ERGIC-53-like isoform X2 [Ruditapes philippinarum]
MWNSVIFLFLACIYVNAELPKIRFEYKYSFKGPHLVQKDHSIPFWEYNGDAIASDDNIRITPSLRSKKGSVWTKNAASFEHFSIEVVFKVTGRGRVGADGLAVWFTEMKGIEGPVFGSNDYWKGLAVLFDSFDNDGQAAAAHSGKPRHNNPYIMAMVNDGTKQYEHQNDGINQQLGGCMRDFRNKPFPIRAKIEYYNKVLTVFFNSGLTNNKDDFELCLRAENVELPKSGYFGVSAATGGLADDHDVLAFLTHSLVPPGQEVKSTVDDAERAKYEKEFEEYYEQLEKAKKEYNEQHPDKQGGENLEQAYENQADRELRMIFEGQNFIHQTLRELSKRFDELLGRQELVLSKVTQMSTGGVAVPQGGQGQQGGGGGYPQIDTIKRHEVERVINTQNDIIQEARQIRQVVNDVQQRANYIQSNLAQGGGQVQQGGGGGGGASPQLQLAMHEVQENLRIVKSDVSQMFNRPQAAVGGCPVPPPCLSPVLFFVAIALQCVVLIGYMIYRQNKENQAKKFF